MPRWRAGFGLSAFGIALLVTALLASGSVVINEVAWGGTAASANDEWIELYNAGDTAVDLAGWVLVVGETRVPLGAVGEGTVEVRRTSIAPHGYFVLERTDDQTVADVTADVLFKGTLSNAGVDLRLLDVTGATADEVLCEQGGWAAGTGSEGSRPYASMERIDSGTFPAQWATNNGRAASGLDAKGAPVSGTPGAENSATLDFRTVPRVALVDPPSGTLSGSVVVRWTASDPDGSSMALGISLFLCDAAGESCRVVVENLTNQGSFLWDVAPYAGASEVFLRVVATDPNGLTGTAVAGPLTLAPTP
ncbi:MAG: lamin tail domain-containing protein [Candidatus Bipolaricaulota bacterium]|nr:lamin tail domain-containing protein [Candidatus Bipolaricaulota bacterium]